MLLEETEKLSLESPQVSTRQRAYIGLSKAGGDMLGIIYNAALLTFFVDLLHMNPESYGIVMIIFAVWNALNDPIFGYISDKKKMDHRGKRSFFIRISSPIYFLGFLMFWLAFPNWSQTAFFIFLLIALFIFDTGLTIFGLNICAIQTGQTTNTNERTSIVIISALISFLPVGIASILPNIILTSNIALYVIRLIFIGIGILALVFMIVGSIKIREQTIQKIESEPMPIWPALKETFRSRSFICFVLVNFVLTAVSFHLIAAMPLYFKYIAQIGDWTVLYVSAPIGLAQIGMYFLYGFLQRKIGLKYSAFLVIGILIFGYLGLFFSNHIILSAISYGLCLWAIQFWWIIANPLVGDIADEDEIKTGRRREGMFFGINALITKPSTSLIIYLFTIIIDNYGYDSELAIQTTEAQFGLRFGMSILSILFLVLAILPLIFYPLSGNRIRMIKEELHSIHNQKHEEVIESSNSRKELSTN